MTFRKILYKIQISRELYAYKSKCHGHTHEKTQKRIKNESGRTGRKSKCFQQSYFFDWNRKTDSKPDNICKNLWAAGYHSRFSFAGKPAHGQSPEKYLWFSCLVQQKRPSIDSGYCRKFCFQAGVIIKDFAWCKALLCFPF